jgi:hypothetical protein
LHCGVDGGAAAKVGAGIADVKFELVALERRGDGSMVIARSNRNIAVRDLPLAR